MLFGEDEIKDYNWEEGRQYRSPADSRSELKPDNETEVQAEKCNKKKYQYRDPGVQGSYTYGVLILQLRKQKESILVDKIFI
jgi:hypothetical protein